MADATPTAQAVLLREGASALRSLEILGSEAMTGELLKGLGFDFPDTDFPVALTGLATDLQAVRTAADALATAQTDQEQASRASTLIGKITTLIPKLAALPDEFTDALDDYADFRDNSGIEDDLLRRLLDLLVVIYLSTSHPTVYRTTELLGLAGFVDQEEDDDRYRLKTRIARVEWERIPLLFSDPLELASQAYDWGDDFKADLFSARLGLLLHSLGVPAVPVAQDPRLMTALGRPTTDDTAWRLTLLREGTSQALVEAGLQMSGVSAVGQAKKGLAVFPYLQGQVQIATKIGSVDLSVGGSMSLDTGLAAILRPPHDLSIQWKLLTSSPAPAVTAAFNLRVGKTAEAGKPFVLLGAPGKTRVTLAGFAGTLRGKTDGSGQELAVEAEAKQLTVAVVPGEGDGFLQKILPPEGIAAALDLGLGLSSVKGLYFAGSAALEVTIPLHLSLADVLRLDGVFVRVAVPAVQAARKLETTVAVNAGVKIGPVAGSVERVGLKLILDFPQDPAGGGFGPVSTQFAFKPPDGAGLAVKGGPVKGGGYLFFDTDNEQYAGILELQFQSFALKAIGLLTTRMPDGSKGFSLLIIITAEFNGIQLGYGFTLNGVGGLIGIHRTLVKEALQAGVKTGAIGSILFPKNPVENAPKLLSDLRTIFPPAPNSFVFGPMVKLGWGTPTLISLELGILLQLPSPLRLIILGRLSLAIPDPDDAVLSLNLEVLGIIDFDEGEASIDARIYDSRLAVFVLTGEMAARMGWAAKPHFELAAGGFHPRFDPPPDFPKLERLALSLATGDNPRLRMETYFGLTSNSLQFGARLDFHVHLDLFVLGFFSVDAQLVFDVLMRFSPFQLEADIGATVDLKRNDKSFLAVWLDVHLKGPGPWRVWGQASFECLGRHTIPIDKTIGPPAPPPPLPESRPIDDLLDAFGEPGNWSAALPADSQMMVTLRDVDPAQGEIFVHPRGELSVRQRIAPLGVTIEKFGETQPTGPLRFEITRFALAGFAVDGSTSSNREHFAPAQFFKLSDDEKLSRPGFEALEAGKRISSGGVDHPTGVETTFGYEDIVVDLEPNTGLMQRRAGAPKTYAPTEEVLAVLSGAGSNHTYSAEGYGIALEEPVYVVAGTGDLEVSAAVGATSDERLTYTEASQARKEHLAKGLAGAERTQVVAAHEAVPA
jgi:Family of unknown function (DUF6603)